SDLKIYVRDPNNTLVELSTNNGDTTGSYGTGCGDRVVFDDSAATSIVNWVPPAGGTFRPEGSLATYIGSPTINGQWHLRVKDSRRGASPGSIVCWSLNITYITACGTGNGVCAGSVPVLVVSSVDVSGGNGDVDADVNECANVSVAIRNDGTAPATVVS